MKFLFYHNVCDIAMEMILHHLTRCSVWNKWCSYIQSKSLLSVLFYFLLILFVQGGILNRATTHNKDDTLVGKLPKAYGSIASEGYTAKDAFLYDSESIN